MDVLVVAERKISTLLGDVLRLEKSTANMIPASCLAEAYEALVQHTRGVVLLNLSDEENREFVCYVENLGLRHQYKIVVMDLPYNAEYQRKKLGADDFLIQPFKSEAVIYALCS